MKGLWNVVQWIVVMAFFGGAVGVVVGFVGPLITHPGSNQGPLLSISTAPAGVVAGSVIGLFLGIWKSIKKS
jgi:hypothetical protein